MKVYKTQDIRNVAILGHGGCGKTTLVEAMANVTGVTSRMGKVVDGNTISDYDKEEIKRKFSISTSIVPIEWRFWKINLLDTPGYLDFVGEVEEALSVADGAIIVISGKAGVEAGTERAWEFCEKYDIPRVFFITDIDDDNADYAKIVEDLRALYGKKIAPFHLPVKEDGKFTGYVKNLKVCNSTDEVLNLSVERAKDFMNLDKGDVIVLTGGFPNTAENRTTNLMKIEVID